MSSIPTQPSQKLLKQPSQQAVIIPFSTLTQKKPSCIFCGRTLSIQKFKGKPVCLSCLQQIPAIFSCG